MVNLIEAPFIYINKFDKKYVCYQILKSLLIIFCLMLPLRYVISSTDHAD